MIVKAGGTYSYQSALKVSGTDMFVYDGSRPALEGWEREVKYEYGGIVQQRANNIVRIFKNIFQVTHYLLLWISKIHDNVHSHVI
jgi:hypothetical protein